MKIFHSSRKALLVFEFFFPCFLELKTLVLDLDETLVHSSPDVPQIISYQFPIFVTLRPGVREFLEILSKYYELVIFTAGQQTYAEKVIEFLDPNHQISHCLYRQHCTLTDKGYIKDLSKLGREMKNIILIDNSYECFSLQTENGYLITSFFDDETDNELLEIVEFLIQMSELDDVRDVESWKEKFDQMIREEESQQPTKSQIFSIPEINIAMKEEVENEQSTKLNSKETSGKLMQFLDEEIIEEKKTPLIISDEQMDQQESDKWNEQ